MCLCCRQHIHAIEHESFFTRGLNAVARLRRRPRHRSPPTCREGWVTFVKSARVNRINPRPAIGSVSVIARSNSSRGDHPQERDVRGWIILGRQRYATTAKAGANSR
jgi:hypothetical protein